MSTRRSTLAILVSACTLMGVLALASVAAQATVVHKYLSRISEVPAKGPPPAEASVEAPGQFTSVTGVTVDGEELYVVARSGSSERLDKFNAATGGFLAQFPKFPTPSSPSLYDFKQGLAVGHGAGETEEYVAGDESTVSGPKGLVAVFDAAGNFQSVWNGSDAPGGQSFGCFECGGYGGIAADESGNPFTDGLVYVLDPGHDVVDVFEPRAGGGEKYLAQLSGPEPGVPFVGLGGGAADGVSVDQHNGDVLVVDGHQAVDVFEPTSLGAYSLARRLTGTSSGPFDDVTGVVADPGNGEIYVSEEKAVDQFSATGVYLGHLTGVGTPSGGLAGVTGMAIDPTTHDLYVGEQSGGSSVEVFGPSIVIPDVTTKSATTVKARSATLNGTVDPEEAEAATCRFEWGTSTSFGKVAPCEPEGLGEGDSAVPVHAALSGLQPDTTYYYRLQASNASGTNPGEASQDQDFTTPGPGIGGASASAVTSVSVTLGAEIDPDNAPTSYYFQYGTSASYESSVPAPPGLSVGSGKGEVGVSVHLQGLAAATTYHYRVVAVAEGAEPVVVESPDQAFTTQAAGTEITQPDGRAWEMVSPPNKQGAGIYPIGFEQGGDIQASASGGGITYTGNGPFVVNPAGNRSLEITQVISSRDAPGSWETADIVTPHDENSPAEPALGEAAEYKFFSSDLSLGLVVPRGDTPLPPLPAGSAKTIYLREADGGYRALVTSGNVAPGAKGGGFGVSFVSASPDLSHVVLASSEALVTGAPSEQGELYEWTAGQLQLVSILPDGKPLTRPAGSPFPAYAQLGDYGSEDTGVTRDAISDDGTRIVWEGSMSGALHYYMRDMARKETLQIDAADEGLPEVQGAEHYRTASSTDSRVFFTSARRLTAASRLQPEGTAGNPEDLYVFETTSGQGEALAGKLTDLSVDANSDEGAGVQQVIGASEDGSYVYFVAGGLLGDAASHGAEGGHYLYVVHYEEGSRSWTAPKFIAALSSEDSPTWANGNQQSLSEMTARVSPNGRYMAFMSDESLTGYDNRDANSGVPDEEVFLYDGSSGRLVCASCNPTGGRPVGMLDGERGEYDERLVNFSQGNWQDRWLAGNIPGWTNKDTGSALYQSRYLSDSGRLFFNSNDALVPADVNGKEDVYEYEPVGVGGCQAPGYGQSASVVYSEPVGGCVGLISAGTSSEESAFMDASESGGDVFFLTQSRLSPADYDTSIDLYDDHECTASEPCAPVPPLMPPPCTTGDACKPGPTPQPTLFGSPSSETFSGAGNVAPAAPESKKVTSRSASQAKKLAKALKSCRGKAKRKRGGCERQARKKYEAKQSSSTRTRR
jgi:hypothetical protein